MENRFHPDRTTSTKVMAQNASKPGNDASMTKRGFGASLVGRPILALIDFQNFPNFRDYFLTDILIFATECPLNPMFRGSRRGH
jgi:hypothetical protein